MPPHTPVRIPGSMRRAPGLLAGVALLVGCGAGPSSEYAHAGEQFSLDARASTTGLVVEVKPVAPWKMNLEFPYGSKATLDDSETTATARVIRSDGFVFDHAWSTEPGHTAAVHARFAVCIDELCTPIEHHFEIAVE